MESSSNTEAVVGPPPLWIVTYLLLSGETSLEGSFLALLAKLREGSRCLFSSTLVFFDMVTVLTGASVLENSESPDSWDLSAISSIRTVCRVSLSFSRIPSLGLKTPRKRGSSSGVSGSR